MSEKIPLDDMKANFTGANFVVTDKAGKTVFSMKRKTPTEDECYYLFKIHEENLDEEGKAKMDEAFKFICSRAAAMGIGMFSFDEVSERAAERFKEILRDGGQLSEEQIDVSIEVFDHATKMLGGLVVGLSGSVQVEGSNPPSSF